MKTTNQIATTIANAITATGNGIVALVASWLGWCYVCGVCWVGVFVRQEPVRLVLRHQGLVLARVHASPVSLRADSAMAGSLTSGMRSSDSRRSSVVS